jgi:hypothetical protein
LVVFDVDDALGDVAIDNVQSEVESFGTETEGEVDFDEKVHKARTHVPPDFGLLVHRVRRGHCGSLDLVHIPLNILCVFDLFGEDHFSTDEHVESALALDLGRDARGLSGFTSDLGRGVF